MRDDRARPARRRSAADSSRRPSAACSPASASPGPAGCGCGCPGWCPPRTRPASDPLRARRLRQPGAGAARDRTGRGRAAFTGADERAWPRSRAGSDRAAQPRPRRGAPGHPGGSAARATPSCRRRAPASWRRRPQSGGASSATCTTAPSSTSWRSRSGCGSCATACPPTRRTSSCSTSWTAARGSVPELRNLAHGIYPPLLRDAGLAAALRAAADRSPLAVTVLDDRPGAHCPGRRPSKSPSTSAAWRRCRTRPSTPPRHGSRSGSRRWTVISPSPSPTTGPASTRPRRARRGPAEHGRPARRRRRHPVDPVDAGAGTAIGGRVPVAAAAAARVG